MLTEPNDPPADTQARPTTARRRRLRSASDATVIPAGRSRRDAGEWAAFGRLLEERREQLGLSRRHAARRAGISERAWKMLETGPGSTVSSTVGSVRLLPNPTDDELTRIADALEMPKDALFGDPSNDSSRETPVDRLTARIAMLSAHDRELVDNLVSRLLVDPR